MVLQISQSHSQMKTETTKCCLDNKIFKSTQSMLTNPNKPSQAQLRFVRKTVNKNESIFSQTFYILFYNLHKKHTQQQQEQFSYASLIIRQIELQTDVIRNLSFHHISRQWVPLLLTQFRVIKSKGNLRIDNSNWPNTSHCPITLTISKLKFNFPIDRHQSLQLL